MWNTVRQQLFVDGRLKHPVTHEFIPCRAVAGVSNPTRKILDELGFVHAYQLVGQFMMLRMDGDAVGRWLRIEVGVRGRNQRELIIRSLRMWCEKRL